MQRYCYIDIAKGLGILLVVWGHIMLTGFTHQFIYAFHMPLFFMLSGMMFQRNKYKNLFDFIRKRAKRLLLPYLVYSVVTWVIWALFRLIRNDEVVSYLNPLLQTVLAKGSGEFMVHNSALWFIPCLFATEIVYFLICKFKNAYVLVISLLFTVLSFVLGYYFDGDWWFLLPWNFDAALIALTFFCIGNLFVKYYSHEQIIEYAENYKVILYVTSALFFALLYYGVVFFGECSMGSSSYHCSGLIFIVRAIVGCFFMLLFSLIISQIYGKNQHCKYPVNYIKWLGVNSLDVMCLHIPIKGVFVLIIAALLHTQTDVVSSCSLYSLCAFIPTVIVVSIAIIVFRFIERKIKVSIRA